MQKTTQPPIKTLKFNSDLHTEQHVLSKMQEVESPLCSEDSMESSASSGLSIHTKNKIYAEVAPKKKKRIYGVGSLKHEASSAYSGPPPPPTDDFAQNLDVFKASLASLATQVQLIATQVQLIAERVDRYDACFDYIAEKDPEFAKFRNRTLRRTEHGCNLTIPDTGDSTNE